MLAGPANFGEPKLQNRCRQVQIPQVFVWHYVAVQVLICHHFRSYVFKPHVLLQQVGAEPFRCSIDAVCGFAVFGLRYGTQNMHVIHSLWLGHGCWELTANTIIDHARMCGQHLSALDHARHEDWAWML